jgi:hypothetical protein
LIVKRTAGHATVGYRRLSFRKFVVPNVRNDAGGAVHVEFPIFEEGDDLVAVANDAEVETVWIVAVAKVFFVGGPPIGNLGHGHASAFFDAFGLHLIGAGGRFHVPLVVARIIFRKVAVKVHGHWPDQRCAVKEVGFVFGKGNRDREIIVFCNLGNFCFVSVVVPWVDDMG